MGKCYFVLLIATFIIIASPQSALAHENRIYQIEHTAFQFTVGSLNEPIAVDDKTGVYLKVVETEAPKNGVAEEKDHHDARGAVEGLDNALKVEIGAGDKKKVLELEPIYGEAGAYRANFTPTIQTTYTYRFFGNVNETPIDVSFTCNPTNNPVPLEDTNPIKLSDDVTQLNKTGAFGCPVAKADLGFPEPSVSVHDLQAISKEAETSATNSLFLALGTLLLSVGSIWFTLRRTKNTSANSAI